MTQDKETAIIEAAQRMIRQGGYNGFSFRNIATIVGIKSSSVHYHFATKEELSIAATHYYTDKFLAFLGDPKDRVDAGEDPVEIYIQAFRNTLTDDQGMCLFGVLATEAKVLPHNVVQAIQQFFERNILWLENAYVANGHHKNTATKKAMQTLALLEGAIMTSCAMNDLKVFDLAIQLLNET